MVKLLLSRGAKVTDIDDFGQDVYEQAMENQEELELSPKIIAMLQQSK